jgi:3-(3-hydroxy-phenyl)propionate hydroxylase
VSVALPDGVRRFEFMIFENETEEQMTTPESMAVLLAKVLPANVDISRLDFIRKRVYTHNARIAERWKIGRIMLAGDAAHIMPVWQGQGYNTGMRDATNLAWKLAYVVNGKGSDALLETYQSERPLHAKAMIDLSVTAGRIFSPRSALLAGLRDATTWVLNYIPPVKRYFMEMRFKPMPFYENGLVVHEKTRRKNSPVGRMFIQPKVRTRQGEVKLLDDALGKGFALLAWGADPNYWLNPRSRAILEALGAKIVTLKPTVQIDRTVDMTDRTDVLGDEQMRFKEWFGQHPGSIVLLRPDRFVAGIAFPIEVDELIAAVADKMGLVVNAGGKAR